MAASVACCRSTRTWRAPAPSPAVHVHRRGQWCRSCDISRTACASLCCTCGLEAVGSAHASLDLLPRPVRHEIWRAGNLEVLRGLGDDASRCAQLNGLHISIRGEGDRHLVRCACSPPSASQRQLGRPVSRLRHKWGASYRVECAPRLLRAPMNKLCAVPRSDVL
jgi:hypothetical protein